MKESCLYVGFDPILNLGIAELFVNVIEMVQVTLLISPTKIYLIFHAETGDRKRIVMNLFSLVPNLRGVLEERTKGYSCCFS